MYTGVDDSAPIVSANRPVPDAGLALPNGNNTASITRTVHDPPPQQRAGVYPYPPPSEASQGRWPSSDPTPQLPLLLARDAQIGEILVIKIHKSTLDKNGKVRVTFSMPVIDDCDCLYLVGWFSEWDEGVYPMERTSSGGWSITLELEAGCTYQYRFRTLDGRWLSDPAEPAASALFGHNRSFIISRSSLTPTAPSS